MRRGQTFFLTGLSTVLVLLLLISPCANAVFFYKSYIVEYDHGRDILCAPYIVQKHDWVYKIFRLRGEIAQRDFPAFLTLFKRLNPQVHDINTIRPGERILIPLREVNKGDLPEKLQGVVTIPFVPVSRISELLKTFSETYTVRRGDCLSKVIAKRYGNAGSRSYREAMDIFRMNNPQVQDEGLIYEGQKFFLIDPSVNNEAWYPSVFDTSGRVRTTMLPQEASPAEVDKTDETDHVPDNASPPRPFQGLETVAALLEGKLLNRGRYHFPGGSGADVQLDLARHPILELKDGTRLLFSGDTSVEESSLDLMKRFWKSLSVVPLGPDASSDQAVSAAMDVLGKRAARTSMSMNAQGVTVKIKARWILDLSESDDLPLSHLCITLVDNDAQKTPDSIIRYLEQQNILIKELVGNKESDKSTTVELATAFPVTDDVLTISFSDPRTFVSELLGALNYRYAQNASITFPYAGVQVEAVSNVVTTHKGTPLFIDFGDLYGDAFDSIKQTGFDIIRIHHNDKPDAIISLLLDKLEIDFSQNPQLQAARRPEKYNTVLTIPGFMVSRDDQSKVFFSTTNLHNRLMNFLKDQGMWVVQIESSADNL
jgi:hypothetical protein